jgi:hypothetical protein
MPTSRANSRRWLSPFAPSKAVSGQGDDTDILAGSAEFDGEPPAILTATGAAVLGIGAIALLIIALLTDTLV